MILDHIFSTQCAMSYNILKMLRGPDRGTFLPSAILLPLPSSSFYEFDSHSPHLNDFSPAHVDFKLRYWHIGCRMKNETILDSEENHQATSLFKRMTQNPLSARPLDLYNIISPTVLITMKNLIFIYVIVLLCVFFLLLGLSISKCTSLLVGVKA